jgi:hypothetical protein
MGILKKEIWNFERLNSMPEASQKRLIIEWMQRDSRVVGRYSMGGETREGAICDDFFNGSAQPFHDYDEKEA